MAGADSGGVDQSRSRCALPSAPLDSDDLDRFEDALQAHGPWIGHGHVPPANLHGVRADQGLVALARVPRIPGSDVNPLAAPVRALPEWLRLDGVRWSVPSARSPATRRCSASGLGWPPHMRSDSSESSKVAKTPSRRGPHAVPPWTASIEVSAWLCHRPGHPRLVPDDLGQFVGLGRSKNARMARDLWGPKARLTSGACRGIGPIAGRRRGPTRDDIGSNPAVARRT